MRSRLSIVAVLLLGVAVSGCRFKGAESFNTSVSPYGEPAQKGDDYTYGGIADANGGQKVRASYSKGAPAFDANGKVDPSYDQPAKGTGQHPGEYPNTARAGYGNVNAPAFQPLPGSINPTGSHNH